MRLVVLSLLLFPILATAQTGAAVQGVVVDKMTGSGIAGISVDLRTASGPQAIHSTITDQSGAFSLAGFAEGAYDATFSDVTERFYLTFSGNPQGRIKIPAAGTVRVNVEMQPVGMLNVRVLDTNGKPLPHAAVYADSVGRFPLIMETGEDGIASFPKRGGFHLVSAGPPENLTLPNGLVWRLPKPQSVLVRGGAVKPVELRLEAVPSSHNHVRGVVVDTSGRPAPSATVTVVRPREETEGVFIEDCRGNSCLTYSRGGGFTLPEVEATVKTGRDGFFEFTSVPSGPLRFLAELDSPGGLFRGSTLTSISRNVDRMEIRLAKPFDLGLAVEWQGGSQWAEVFRHAGVSLTPLESPTVSDETLIFADRTTRVGGLFPGRYTVRLSPGQTFEFYPASVFLGSKDVSGSEFFLNASSPPLRFVFKDDAASLRAVIPPTDSAMLFLLPQSPDYGHARRAAICQPGGICEMKSIAPGDYYAFVFRGQWENNEDLTGPQFLQAVMPKATPVHLSGGMTFLNLPLIDWPE